MRTRVIGWSGVLLLVCGMARADTYSFTNGIDWNLGTYSSTDALPNPPGTALRLSTTIQTPFEHIWVALSGRDSVARINTNYVEPNGGGFNGNQVVTVAEMANGGGPVLGEYLTRPQGRNGNPSRTTVDKNGDVWVGNRNEADGNLGSAAKITASPGGLTSTGVWNGSTFDRLAWANGSGVDSNGGTTTAADTAIVEYIRTTGTNVRSVAVDKNNNVWIGGLGNRTHQLYDSDGNPVAGAGNSFDINLGGYGALVDSTGVVWSAGFEANSLLRHDPATNTTVGINNGRNTYGLGTGKGPDGKDKVWLSNWTSNSVQRFDVATGTLEGTFSLGSSSSLRGVAVTPADNDVWVAASGSAHVVRVNNDGSVQGIVNVGSQPTGVAVDSNGKVWVTNFSSNSVMRIDPTLGTAGQVDLTIDLGPNSTPYNYSDMTGTVLFSGTNPQGTWRRIQDGGSLGRIWEQILWNQEAEGSIPAGTSITMEARAADTEAGLNGKPWTSYASGATLGLVGRYLELRATLTRSGGTSGLTPLLSDITVTARGPSGDVPEPASLAVWAALGVVALVATARKRRPGGR